MKDSLFSSDRVVRFCLFLPNLSVETETVRAHKVNASSNTKKGTTKGGDILVEFFIFETSLRL